MNQLHHFRNMEEKISESEKKYKSIFELSNDIIVLVGLDSTILDMNNRVVDLLGYSKEFFIGKKFPTILSKILTKESSEIAMETFKKRIKGVDIPPYILDLISKDGSVKKFEITGLTRKENGKPIGTLTILRDVDERIKAEKVLKESQYELEKKVKERTENLTRSQEELLIFKKFAENSPAGIGMAKLDATVTYVNPAMAEIVKGNKEKMIGTKFPKYFHKDYQKKLKEHIQETMKKGFWKGESEFVTSEGKKISVSENFFIIKDNKGKPKYFADVVTDITKEKVADQNLRERTENLTRSQEELLIFKKFAENSPAGIGIAKLDGAITYANSALVKITNEKREEMIGRKFINYFPKEDQNKVKKHIQETMKKGFWKGESIILNIEGKKVPISENFFLIKDNKGKPKYFANVVTDLTKEKETDQKIKESYEKLKELEKLKSKFLIITSHELKTPLTPAKIQTQMLLQGDLGELNEKQRESFQIILRNINRLDELIGDILEIARIQSEGFKLEPKKLQIINLVKMVEKNLAPVAKKKGLKFSCKADTLPSITVDKKRIIEVLINLIENAIKFTEKGSIRIEAKQQGNDILICVKDTGVGIHPSHFEEIFKSFYQIEPTYTRKHGGTGLGLSICKNIIEQHNGKIWVESIVGKGSTFYFTLPIKKLRQNLNTNKPLLKEEKDG